MASEILKLSSAIALGGKIVRAGSLIEVTGNQGRHLRERGKAVFASETDLAQGEIVARDLIESVTPLVASVPESAVEGEETAPDAKRRRRAE